MVGGSLFIVDTLALAHVAPASPEWQPGPGLPTPGAGVVMGDPDVVVTDVSGANALVSFDLSRTGTCGGAWTEAVEYKLWRLDSEGARFGVSLGGIWMAQGATCTSPDTFHNSLGYFAHDGAFAFELVVKGVTSGTVYGLARTTGVFAPPAVPENLTVLSTAGGGRSLSFDMLAALALFVGFDDEAVTATAVAMAESSGRTKAVSYIGCCYGLWQIHAVAHGVDPSWLYVPLNNATKAREIFEADGWDPWEAYTGPDGTGSDGPWLGFESKAVVAVDRQLACGMCALDSIDSAPKSGGAVVALGWDESELAASYDVKRAPPGGVLGSTVHLVFTDNNALANQGYAYSVRGCNVNGCSVYSTTVSVTAGAEDPDIDPDTGLPYPDNGATDPDSEDGASCSGWNVFCWIKAALKWAFVPGAAAWAAWNTFYETLQTRPPFSVLIIGFEYVTDFFDAIKVRFDAATTSDWCYSVPGPSDVAPGEGGGTENHEACLGTSVSSLNEGTTGTIIEWCRWILGTVITAMTAFRMWKILSAAFGNDDKGDLEGALREDAQAGVDQ